MLITQSDHLLPLVPDMVPQRPLYDKELDADRGEIGRSA
jgi:hypothetical protein